MNHFTHPEKMLVGYFVVYTLALLVFGVVVGMLIIIRGGKS